MSAPKKLSLLAMVKDGLLIDRHFEIENKDIWIGIIKIARIMATYQTNAIILKREDIFEADRLYHLYTEEFGKVRAVAGSVRKINAKLTGHLEPFNLVWVEINDKKRWRSYLSPRLYRKKIYWGTMLCRIKPLFLPRWLILL